LKIFFSFLYEVEYFRVHYSYKFFVKKWNTSAYFVARYKHITLNIEESTKKQLPNDINIQNIFETDNFIFSTTQCCLVSIISIWNNYYIFALAHRFFQLTIQIINRYIYWAEHEIDLLNQKTPLNEYYSYLYYDINLFIRRLSSDLKVCILNNTTRLPEDIIQEIFLIIAHKINDLKKLLEISRDKIFLDITKKSQFELESIRIISLNYFNVEGKSVKNVPMPYAQKLLEPCLTFHKNFSKLIGPDWEDWIRQILITILSKYREEAEKIISSERINEEFITKLKSNSTTTDNEELSEFDKMSNVDKMKLQLLVDIRYIFRTINDIGIRIETIPPHSTLIALTSSAEKYVNLLTKM